MNAVTKTIVETLAVGAIGLSVALSVNAVRGGNRIHLSNDYFPPATDVPPTPAPLPGDPTKDPVKPPAGTHAVHEFKEITVDQIAAFYEGTSEFAEDWESRVVFIDARNDKAFAAGRIPGAVQIDHYKLEGYIDAALAAIEGRDLVIVYCNGGECDDSISTCRILTRDHEVPMERLRLFAGGWAEWKKNKMPCEGECKETE